MANPWDKPTEVAGTNPWDKPVETVAQETPAWKNQALTDLSHTYKGDWLKFQTAVMGGKKPVADPSSARGNEINDLITTIRNINNSPTFEDFQAKQPDNKYTDYLTGIGGRRDWNTASDAQTSGGQIRQALVPNALYRTQQGEGTFSKGVGGLWDVLTAPTRAITAGIEGLGPEGQSLTFAQRMGRPNEKSTTGEVALDVLAPSGVGNKVAKGLGSAGRIIEDYAIARNIAPDIAKNISRAALGPGVEKAADVVFDIPHPGSKFTTDVLPRIGAGAEKGAREGLSYAAIPTTMTATSPDEDISSRAPGELGAMVGLSAISGGIGGALFGPKLNELGNELTGGYSTFNRIKEAARHEPVTGSATGVGQVTKLNRGVDDLIGSLSKKRDDIYAKLDANAVPEQWAQTKSGQEMVPTGGIQVGETLQFGSKGSAPSVLGNVVRDTDAFPVQSELASKLLESLVGKYTEVQGVQTLAELAKMRSVAGKIMTEATDPDKIVAARMVFDDIKNAMAKQEEGSHIFTMKAEGGPSAPMHVSTLPEGMSLREWHRLDRAAKAGQLSPEEMANFMALKPRPGMVSSVAVSTESQAAKDLTAPLYKDMSQAYDVKENFLDAAKAEQKLRGAAASRLDPLTRGDEFRKALEGMDGIVALFNKHNIPGSATGTWTRADIDYLTPAVIREVRKRLKGEEGTAFGTMLQRLSENKSLLGLPALFSRGGASMFRAALHGAPVGGAITGRDSYRPEGTSEGMVPMSVLGNK